MYQTDFLCTYHLFDDEYESDTLYRTQFSQAMNCNDEYDDNIVRQSQNEAYELIKNNSIGKLLIQKLNSIEFPSYINIFLDFSSSKEELERTKFTALFGYNTFYLIHELICNIKHNQNINDDIINQIINNL